MIVKNIHLLLFCFFVTFSSAQTLSLGKNEARRDYSVEEFEQKGNDFESFLEHYADSTNTGNNFDNPPTTKKCARKSSYEEKSKCLSEYIQSTVMSSYRVERVVKHGWVKLKVRFKIDQVGDVIDIVIEGSTPKAREEAIRVLRGLKQFNPAIKNGKPVEIIYSMPIVAYVN